MEPRFSRAGQTDGDDDEAFRLHCLRHRRFWGIGVFKFLDPRADSGLEPWSRWEAGDWRAACDDGLTASRVKLSRKTQLAACNTLASHRVDGLGSKSGGLLCTAVHKQRTVVSLRTAANAAQGSWAPHK